MSGVSAYNSEDKIFDAPETRVPTGVDPKTWLTEMKRRKEKLVITAKDLVIEPSKEITSRDLLVLLNFANDPLFFRIYHRSVFGEALYARYGSTQPQSIYDGAIAAGNLMCFPFNDNITIAVEGREVLGGVIRGGTVVSNTIQTTMNTPGSYVITEQRTGQFLTSINISRLTKPISMRPSDLCFERPDSNTEFNVVVYHNGVVVRQSVLDKKSKYSATKLGLDLYIVYYSDMQQGIQVNVIAGRNTAPGSLNSIGPSNGQLTISNVENEDYIMIPDVSDTNNFATATYSNIVYV